MTDIYCHAATNFAAICVFAVMMTRLCCLSAFINAMNRKYLWLIAAIFVISMSTEALCFRGFLTAYPDYYDGTHDPLIFSYTIYFLAPFSLYSHETCLFILVGLSVMLNLPWFIQQWKNFKKSEH